MPIHTGRDYTGWFWQWGDHGTKYYYNPANLNESKVAKEHAIRQYTAAKYNGYRGM